MIHWIIFAERRPDISKLQFHSHWRDKHALLIQKNKGFRRYVQNHILEPPEGLTFDGMVDMWMDNEKAAVEAIMSPGYRNYAFLDEPNFVRPGNPMIFTEDYILLEGPSIAKHDILGKVIFPLKRKPGMEVEEFRRYWREVHGPLVLELPRLRRYVQCHAIEAKYVQKGLNLPGGEPYYDGVEQLWFDNRSALREALDSLVAFVHMQPDLANFVDLGRFFSLVAEENRAIWPEG